MAYTEKQKEKCRLGYELGVLKKKDFYKKMKVNESTIERWAKLEGWIYGRYKDEIKDKSRKNDIKKKGGVVLVQNQLEKYGKVVEDSTEILDTIRSLTRKGINSLIDEINESGGNVDRSEAERLFSIQKLLKISNETIDLNLKTYRIAIGLEDKKEGSTQTVNIQNNTLSVDKKLSELTDSELLEFERRLIDGTS